MGRGGGHWGKLSFKGGQAVPVGGRGGGRRERGGGGGRRGPRPPAFSGKLSGLQHARNGHAGPGAGPSRLLESALEDKDKPFLHPKERQLVNVPLRFESVRHYCSLIAHNMLAEFWHVYREGPRGAELHGTVVSDNELYVDGGDEDGMMHHLLSIKGSVHLVTNMGLAGVDSMKLTVRPALRARGSVSVRSYGYVGSYINELKALIELAESREVSNVLQSVLHPECDLPGDFTAVKLRAEVPINPSQKSTVDGLQYSLEKIQGPPGTGKSTTIFHIICSRVPAGQRVLVTCSRNVAVESIAQKLEHCHPDGLVVFGNASRIGETARRYLLDTKCERQPVVGEMATFSRRMLNAGRELADALRQRKPPPRGPPIRCRSMLWKRAWSAYMNRRCALHRYAQLLKDWALRVGKVETVANGCKEEVLSRSLIMLCTIASTGRLLREWEENCSQPLNTHTVIVDECGCTTESSVALLMRMDPKNLIMVGDHKQLPPTSMVPPRELEGTGHDRSLLERCVQASGRVHRLVEQYRMHDAICRVVSTRFYNSMLQTPASVRADRQRKEKRPLVWVSVRGTEAVPPKTKSYVNYEEIDAVQRVATFLREKHATATIAVLTFYKGQLQELMRATPAALGVEVLTVDSCQGSEFDYVILSTVRANLQGTIGFVKDKQRINVAISRSLYGLVVVGDDHTLRSDNDWQAVRDACELSSASEWRPKMRLDGFDFESVFDQLRGLQMKKREAALAQQEQDAEKLMQSQPSFRAKPGVSSRGRARAGAAPSGPGFTVIGGGGAKSAAALRTQGQRAGGGDGGRGARGGRDWGDSDARDGDWTCPGCSANVFASKSECFKCGTRKPWGAAEDSGCGRQRGLAGFDLATEEFPDLDAGSDWLMHQPKKVYCRAHGMLACEVCGSLNDSAAPPRGASRVQADTSTRSLQSFTGEYRRDVGGAGGPGLRIDKAAAARFVANGIGYTGSMPISEGGSRGNRGGSDGVSVAGKSAWGRAMQMSAERRVEPPVWPRKACLPAPGDFGNEEWDEGGEENKWRTCSDCGLQGDALEEDSDNPGIYYCVGCWLKWENGEEVSDRGAEVSDRGAGEGSGAIDPNMSEASLVDIFAHLGAATVQEVLAQFEGFADKLERTFNVLLDMGDAKAKCYDDEWDEEEQDCVEGIGEVSEADGQRWVHVVEEVAEDAGLREGGGGGGGSVLTSSAAPKTGTTARGRGVEDEPSCETPAKDMFAPPASEAGCDQQDCRSDDCEIVPARVGAITIAETPSTSMLATRAPRASTRAQLRTHAATTVATADPGNSSALTALDSAGVAGEDWRIAAATVAADTEDSVVQSSAECADCRHRGLGRVDANDGNFYCNACWAAFLDDSGVDDAAPSSLITGQKIQQAAPLQQENHSASKATAMRRPSAAAHEAELLRWARARVCDLLPRDTETHIDADVVVSALLAAESLDELKEDTAMYLSSRAPAVTEFAAELWRRHGNHHLPREPSTERFSSVGASSAAAFFNAPGDASTRGNPQATRLVPHQAAAQATQTVEAYVHERFERLGVTDEDIERYVVEILKMKDDALSPIDDALEQIHDLLRGLQVPENQVQEFVRDAPLAAAVL